MESSCTFSGLTPKIGYDAGCVGNVVKGDEGVLGIAPDIILRASACALSSFVVLTLVCVARIHVLTQYESIGRITAVYIHLHVLGVRPQVGPTALLHCMREDVAASWSFADAHLANTWGTNITWGTLAASTLGEHLWYIWGTTASYRIDSIQGPLCCYYKIVICKKYIFVD